MFRSGLGAAIALLAATPSAGAATAHPDGLLFFVNYFGQPVDLTVDGEKLDSIPHTKVIGYPVVRGEHDIVLAAGSNSVYARRPFQVETVAQDGKGRSYWCFVATSDPTTKIALRELEPSQCAKLISAVEMDNR